MLSFLTLYHAHMAPYRNMFMLADAQDKHSFTEQKVVILSGYNIQTVSQAQFSVIN